MFLLILITHMIKKKQQTNKQTKINLIYITNKPEKFKQCW